MINRRAFTLLEVIIVMVIMAIIMAIGVRQFRQGEVRQELRAAADELVATWQELQARSLAGLAIPADTPFIDIYASEILPDAPPEQATQAEGYGLLLFNFTWPYTSPYWQYFEDELVPDNPNYLIDGYLFFMACAIPYRPFLESFGYTPNFQGGNWADFDIYRGNCFYPLREFAPILQSGIVVPPETVKVGASVSSLIPTYQDSGPAWSPYGLNYDLCDTDASPDVPPYVQGSFFMAAYPPQPTIYLNGRSGCRILQFALSSRLDLSQQLWLRFDLRTGQVSTYETEPI